MRQSLFGSRFLARLQATGLQDENPRVERVLAISRVALGLTALIVDLIHPLAPEPYNQLLILLLMMYCVQNLGFLIWMIMNPDAGATFVKVMQASDVFWPIVLCLFADPPSSLVFVFFLFALMTTAYRFGVYETVLTALGCTLVLSLQEGVVAIGPKELGRVLYTPLDVSRLVLRSCFLIMAGFLLGYLAEREKELRAEIAFTNHLLSLTRVGNRFNEVVSEVSAELAKVFGGKSVYALVRQASYGRMFRWEIVLAPRLACEVREIAAPNWQLALLTKCPHSFCISRQNSGQVRVDAIDDEGRRIDVPTSEELLTPLSDATSALVVQVDLGREWNGRFVLVGGKLGWNRERELRFAQNVLRQVAPALYSIYLIRRLRSRAGAMERARVARELHDTAIQSLD